jgi:hypothetical protein
MKKVMAVLMAAGIMGAVGTTFAAPAEAHWRRGDCCVHYRAVRYYKPVDKLVRKVTYERVTFYRTMYVKRLYRDRCCCRKFYRTVRYYKPVEKLVPRVTYERVRAYRPYIVRRAYRSRCCGGWW